MSEDHMYIDDLYNVHKRVCVCRIANLTGIAIPPLGVFFRRRFGGSWLPFFAAVAGFHMACALVFCKLASVNR